MKLWVFTIVVFLLSLWELCLANVLPLKDTTKILPKVLLPSKEYQLSNFYYVNSCPYLEAIVHQKMQAWFRQDPTLAASLIRLHFHDCAVRGCDASVLLNHVGSERKAFASKTLRGFEVIDDIKSVVEKTCPKTVSCADILTAVARDATVLLGGPFWEVPFGRKDGKISISKEADIVPQGHENVTGLIEFFKARGLNELDLVVLSGSHTIGRTSCYSILQRLAKPDSSLDKKYWRDLIKQCKWSSTMVNLDVTTPKTFDTAYYTNLQNRKGLLSTDQALYSDPRTASFVDALASQPFLFSNQFLVSMVKLGNVQVLMGPNEGEIRHNCSCVNP